MEAGADPGNGSAKAKLEHWTPASGRGRREVIELPGGGRILLLDESYNANPTSMAAALSVLAATGHGRTRRHAILGDMLELGPDEVTFHEGAGQAARHGGDRPGPFAAGR